MATAPIAFDRAAIFKDPEANPITIARNLDEATQREWRTWLPETLANYTGLTEEHVQQRDKLNAIQVVATNPDAFHDWPLFLACVIAFNHRRVNFEWLDKPSIPELAWGCTVMRTINPTESFGDGVLRFIGSTMIHDGLVFFPWTGGKGLALCDSEHEWAHGLIDRDAIKTLVDKIRPLWENGDIQHLELSEVDTEDAFQTQLADLVRAQAYIRMQKP